MSPDHPLRGPLADRIGHTLPGRVLAFADAWPERVALREKWRGLWRETIWREYADHVIAAADALAALGLNADDRVAILSENRPEWLYLDMGAQALGAMSAGIYTTNPAPDVAYVLNHCRAAVVLAEDQEQVDKILHSPEPLPHLRHVIYLESEGIGGYDDPRLMSWSQFHDAALQRRHAQGSSADWHDRLAALDADRPAVVVYTSGTTGQPKGALLTSRNMLGLTAVYLDELEAHDGDTLLSYLPLCHVAEKAFTQFLPLTAGASVHFGESIDTVRQDLAEVSPSVFLGVPRIWEKLAAGVDVAIRNTSPEKRALYRWAVGVAERHLAARESGKVRALLRVQRWLADVLVLAALRERLGMGRVRLAFSGAAPIAPELLRWLNAVGIPVLEGYGLSETSGLATLNQRQAQRLGSVGRVATGVELDLAEDGEILVRGSNIFAGYLDNPDATAEAIDPQGWLHTGDIGRIDDDGYLHITGRKKEIFVTAGGKNVAPAKIENALKTSPYIREAASIGDRRKFISALVAIDGDMVGDWAARQGIAYTSYEDLTRQPEVITLIDTEIRRINDEQLARVEQVRAFRLFPKELHQDDGEMTATQKLKRKVVEQRFADLIAEIYDDAAGAAA